MQLNTLVRVMTVVVVSLAMLAVIQLSLPTTPVQGKECLKVDPYPHHHDTRIFTIAHLGQADITGTVEITTSAILTETADSTESTPISENSRGASDLLNLIQTQPLIPLGFLLIFLVSAIILILISAQRKTKTTRPTKKEEPGTAPLMPKITPAQSSGFLQLKSNPEITFPLAIDDIRIGRAPDNTIVISSDMPGSETVSKYHARLYHLERWILEDLDSTNGIYVNGQRTGRNYLRNGWEIGIGGVEFVFHTSVVEAA